MRFGKKKECALCAKVCFEADMIEQRGVFVCSACVDKA